MMSYFLPHWLPTTTTRGLLEVFKCGRTHALLACWEGTTCSTSSRHRCREFGQLLLVRCFRDVVLEIDICLHKTYLAKSAVKIVSSSKKPRTRARVEYPWAICCCWRSVFHRLLRVPIYKLLFDESLMNTIPTMTNLARCNFDWRIEKMMCTKIVWSYWYPRLLPSRWAEGLRQEGGEGRW